VPNYDAKRHSLIGMSAPYGAGRPQWLRVGTCHRLVATAGATTGVSRLEIPAAADEPAAAGI
jgi:hypothetical protein